MVSGYSSISFTIQSASEPVVAAKTCARIAPAIVTSCVSGAVSNVMTSGRPSTNRWSWTSQVVHPEPPGKQLTCNVSVQVGKYVGGIGRWRYGTGCRGSET